MSDKRLCWHCEKRPAASNDLGVCEECWQEWETHRAQPKVTE